MQLLSHWTKLQPSSLGWVLVGMGVWNTCSCQKYRCGELVQKYDQYDRVEFTLTVVTWIGVLSDNWELRLVMSKPSESERFSADHSRPRWSGRLWGFREIDGTTATNGICTWRAEWIDGCFTSSFTGWTFGCFTLQYQSSFVGSSYMYIYILLYYIYIIIIYIYILIKYYIYIYKFLQYIYIFTVYIYIYISVCVCVSVFLCVCVYVVCSIIFGIMIPMHIFQRGTNRKTKWKPCKIKRWDNVSSDCTEDDCSI